MAFLEVDDVTMRFGGEDGFLALDRISLNVNEGEFVTLIGHSGCGKSTLLNLIAGLIRPTRGGVQCQGVPVTGPGPDRAVVFQNHSLLPWMTCFENVMLGVRHVFGGRLGKAELKSKVEAALGLVHLEDAMGRYPAEISGGMKQRVGIARALAIEPRVLLMDEPFGALDALTRANLQDELLRIVDETRSTVVMVTHDVDEAILLSDRVALMTNGPAAHIGEVVAIDLPRPRDRVALAKDLAYAGHRQRLIEFLYLKQRRAA